MVLQGLELGLGERVVIRDLGPAERTSHAELETLVRTGSWDVEFDSIRVVCEPGGLRHLGALVKDLGAASALVVTDKGVSATGHVDRAVHFLREAGIEAQVFDRVVENPTTRIVEEATRVAKEHAGECIVGLGGGSARLEGCARKCSRTQPPESRRIG